MAMHWLAAPRHDGLDVSRGCFTCNNCQWLRAAAACVSACQLGHDQCAMLIYRYRESDPFDGSVISWPFSTISATGIGGTDSCVV